MGAARARVLCMWDPASAGLPIPPEGGSHVFLQSGVCVPETASERRVSAEARTVSRTRFRVVILSGCLVSVAGGVAVWAQTARKEPPPQWVETPTGRWMVHDEARPAPPVVMPGVCGAQETPARPPADAVVLFDGKDLSKWRSDKGGPAKWKVENGYMEVNATGSISSTEDFGDCQLHIEWMAPYPPKGSDQGRGNSGVFMMSNYEIQVLDSYDNATYADGQAGAVYGQYPPLVNASRPPGEWQSYDIVWHRPRFDGHGAVVQPARVTVFQNGVLVQDDVVLSGPTAHQQRPPYERHPDRLPLELQDHGNRTRFRNIWVRELERR